MIVSSNDLQMSSLNIVLEFRLSRSRSNDVIYLFDMERRADLRGKKNRKKKRKETLVSNELEIFYSTEKKATNSLK